MSYKIKQADGKFHASESGRIQHYETKEQAKKKAEKLELKKYQIVESEKRK